MGPVSRYRHCPPCLRVQYGWTGPCMSGAGTGQTRRVRRHLTGKVTREYWNLYVSLVLKFGAVYNRLSEAPHWGGGLRRPYFRRNHIQRQYSPRRLITDQRCVSCGNWYSSPVDARVCHIAKSRSLCVLAGPRIGPAVPVPGAGYPTTATTTYSGCPRLRTATSVWRQERRGAKYRSSCTRAVILTSAAARQWRQRLGRSGSAWTVPHRSQARNWSPVTSTRR